MKKILLTVCALFLTFAAPLTAFEWGGLITNDTGIETPDFSDITFNQSNGVSLWFKSPVDAEGNFGFTGELLYKYKYAKPKDVDGVFTNIFDVTLLKLSGDVEAGNGILSLDAGRFSYVDNSGKIISHTVDGIAVDYAVSLIKVGAFAGYTGLLNSLNGDVMSAGDYNDFYDMSYAYAPVGLSFELPYLLGNQSIGIQAYGLFDCGDLKTNLYYASLTLSGPVSNSVYYNVSTVFGAVDFKDFMNYSGLSVLIFPTETIAINAGVDFGSAADDKLTAYYSPISSDSADISSSITPKAGFTYGTDQMCFDLKGKYIIGYDYTDKKFTGSGAEIDTDFVYNIFSDLQVGLAATAYIDTTPAKVNKYTVDLNIALAF